MLCNCFSILNNITITISAFVDDQSLNETASHSHRYRHTPYNFFIKKHRRRLGHVEHRKDVNWAKCRMTVKADKTRQTGHLRNICLDCVQEIMKSLVPSIRRCTVYRNEWKRKINGLIQVHLEKITKTKQLVCESQHQQMHMVSRLSSLPQQAVKQTNCNNNRENSNFFTQATASSLTKNDIP